MDDLMMEDIEEGDDGMICRVCRTEAEPDHPLFHPCKCSGSIRYVHSDCLLQWLNHSKKHFCELCGHAFSFQKVYPGDIPEALPLHRLIRKLVVDTLRLVMLALRAVLVALTWLVLLPLVMIGAWRSYFLYGSPLAMMIAGRTPVANPSNTTTSAQHTANATDQALSFWQVFQSYFASNSIVAPAEAPGQSLDSNVGLVKRIITALVSRNIQPLQRIVKGLVRGWTTSDLSERVFKGQILTVCIVITFLAVFLLREWIFQNAGPGPHQEVENGRIPRPEEFRVNMRALWRQRRLRNLDREDPVDVLLDPAHRLVLPNPPRPGPGRREHDALPAEAVQPPAGLRNATEENTNEEDQWVDEEEWLEDNGNGEERASERATDDDASGIRNHAWQNGFSDIKTPEVPGQTDENQQHKEQGPAPSLLQQLRQQHRANGDSNMSFEEFLIHQRHSVIDRPDSSDTSSHQSRGRRSASPPFPDRSPNNALSPLAEAHPNFPRGGPSSHANTPTKDESGPSAQRDEESEKIQEEFTNFFVDPTEIDQIRRERLARNLRFANEDQLRFERELREEQARRAARAEGENLPGRRAFNAPPALPGRVRDVLDEAGRLVMDADEGEEVEMGPEPGLDDDDADDEGGLMIDGDVDGILEAIGMRGPFAGIFQNFLLICIVLNCGICVLVNVPFIIGKVHLMADIRFLGRLIRLPIVMTRLVTDPVIDGVLSLAKLVVYRLPSWMTATALARFGSGGAADAVTTATVGSSQSGYLVVDWLKHQTSERLSGPFGSKILTILQVFPGEVGYQYRKLAAKVTAFGMRDTASSRAAAIALGLFDLDLALLLTAALGEQYLGSFGKTVADLVEQHGVIVKLGFFMSVELLVFPLSMGYFLDFCTLPLFPSGTLHYRWIAQFRNPILSAFVHWLAGTMFMFAFARFLSTCRSICRKGAMYIIRDPQDPSFSPVREILDKKTSVQLYKLFISATMYLSVMAIPLGGLLMALRVSGLSILPLRWSFRDSLSTAPFDILAFLLFFPVHFKQIKWQDKFKTVTRLCFKQLSESLRLSSYFRGVKIPEEEQAGKFEGMLLDFHQTSTAMLSKFTKRRVEIGFYEGSYMRVPYADQVVLLKPRKNVFIPVDSMGIPKTNDDKVNLLMQNRAAINGHRDPRKDYCMVYLPPFYRIRFWLFGLLLWSFISWIVVFTILIPVLVGRTATYHFVGRDVHDGINMIAGFYTCLIALRLGKRVGKRVASVVRRYLDTPRYRNPFSWKRYIVKEGDFVLRMARWAYLAVILYVVLPILVGLCLELYVFAPLKYGKSDVTPVFYAAEAWCTGIVAMSICYFRTHFRTPILRAIGAPIPEAPNDIPEDRAEVQMHARMLADALRPRNLHRILVPALKYLAVAAFVPGLVSAALAASLRLDVYQSALTYRFIHPFLLYTVMFGRFLTLARRKAQQWSVNALESEYLVEQRVINLEDSEAGGGHDVKVFDPHLHAADVHHE